MTTEQTAPSSNTGTVKIGESRYEIVPIQNMSWGELRDLKRLSGMLPGDIGNALNGADPDAWFAVLYVSIRRVAPQLTENRLEGMLTDHPLIEIAKSVETIEPVEVELPPPSVSPTVLELAKSEPASGETTPLVSTLEVSGVPA